MSVVKMKSIYEKEDLAVWVGWSINWLQPVVDAMESILFPLWESWSSFGNFEDLVLQSSVGTEQIEFRSLSWKDQDYYNII